MVTNFNILQTLKNYKPMMKQFFSKGMFDPLDDRYFHLINRAPGLGDEIRFENFPKMLSLAKTLL